MSTTSSSDESNLDRDWILTVYVEDDPQQRRFATEAEARSEANRLELAGWEDGIPDTLKAPDGRTVWHRDTAAG
jgi:hypothetical protein